MPVGESSGGDPSWSDIRHRRVTAQQRAEAVARLEANVEYGPKARPLREMRWGNTSRRGKVALGGAAVAVAAGVVGFRNRSSGRREQQELADGLNYFDQTRQYRQDPNYPAFRDMMNQQR